MAVRPSHSMIHSPEHQAAVRLVQQAFPHSTVQRAWPLHGGISATMVALDIQQPDGRSQTVIVRTHAHPAAAEKEYRLLKLLQEHEIKTPVPYLLERSAASLVLAYLPGEMNFAPANLNSHMQQMAAQLARLHQLDLSSYDVTFLPEAGHACVALGRERPSTSPHFPQENQIRQTLAVYSLPPSANKPSLLHGDFWPGNCLWQAGELTAVIDWEDAQLGDPLVDLAQSRSEIAWIFGPEALEQFTRHYHLRNPLDYSQLPYRDLCAALRQIRLVGDDLAGFADYFAGYGRHDITPQAICQNLNTFINNALAKLTH